MGFLLLKGFLQYFFNCFYNLQFKLLSPLWHWLGWIHRQQILGYTCGIWRSMPSFYEVVDLKYKKTADWYICESFVSLKTWNYNILIIEGLFSQEEEEVEFRKKSSIISKLPNFISQSKQMQCIPSKSIGPKWKSKKFSKKGAAVKKGSTKSQEVFYLYLDTPQAVAKCILREFWALKRKPPEIQKDFWTLQNCLLLRFHILVI